MTRAEFAALPGDDQVDVEITFNHGPQRAAIHHDLRRASIRYVLSRYPAFDSIRIVRANAVPRTADVPAAKPVGAGVQ